MNVRESCDVRLNGPPIDGLPIDFESSSWSRRMHQSLFIGTVECETRLGRLTSPFGDFGLFRLKVKVKSYTSDHKQRCGFPCERLRCISTVHRVGSWVGDD